MKKVYLMLIIFILMIGVIGCSKYLGVKQNSIENNTSTKMSMSYDKFTGSKETEIKVNNGETVVVSVDIVTKNGFIEAYIFKDKDNNIYEGHDIQTSNFTVTLSEPGNYTLKVNTDNHKGSYSFSWK